MSTFTIQLNELMLSGFNLGMDTYPIFDESYRVGLNQKIYDHYALYEIGLETDEMFKFALNRRMREIMPYYNQLYMSEKIVFDPLSTMNFTETGVSSAETSAESHADSTTSSINETDSTTDTTSSSTSDGDSTSDTTNTSSGSTDSRARAVNSELPQVRLSGDEDYATSAADSVSDSNTSSETTAHAVAHEESVDSGTTGVVGHEAGTGSGLAATDTTASDTASGTLNREMQGYQGHAAELLMRYRESLLNIDMLVIANLNNLFMGVWDNGDEHSTIGRNYNGYFYPTI